MVDRKENDMKTIELAKSLQNGMFAERDTIQEAYDYAIEMGKSCGCSPQMITAVQVVVNTIMKKIVETEETA